MFPEVVQALIGPVDLTKRGILWNYRRYTAVTRLRGNYPAVIAESNGRVDGILLTNLTSRQIGRLDAFECLNEGLYEKTICEIELANGDPNTVNAWVYVAGTALLERLLEPLKDPWDPEHFSGEELDWYLQHLGIRDVGKS